MRLKGQTAIITGGARGIGLETALLFSREGAKVAVWDYAPAAWEQARQLFATGAEVLYLQVDVSNAGQVEAALASTLERFGAVDILVNNAGITRDAMLKDLTEEQWDAVLAVNLKGVFLCGRAVSKVMAAKGRGKIISASSVVAANGNVGQTNYVASKAGVEGLTRAWAKELGRKGLNVNAVAPGFIRTEMTASVPDKVLAGMEARTPLGRLGNPADVARAYLFLASAEADYINGAILPVDGGLTI